MKIKTAALTGPALDWAVAKCADLPYPIVYDESGEAVAVSPSTDWSQGGPIIEREGIRLHRSHTGAWWAGSEAEPQRPIAGPTPLVAAMRCYVASRLGDEVEVPDELL